jgi:hypothetical protein
LEQRFLNVPEDERIPLVAPTIIAITWSSIAITRCLL